MAFANILSPIILKKYLEFWISEDIPNFDLSSIALSSKKVCAHIQMNEDGVLAGVPFAEELFKYLDCSVSWRCSEGSLVKNKSIVCEVRGLSSKLMMAERTVLNILSRASGVATVARRVKNKISKEWKGEISGTRKTTPGMRMVEKYAMYIGGISTHRYDLSSIIMLKDNHVKVNGSIENSVKMVKEKVGNLIMIEAECATVEQALAAARAGANVVMLDNFDAKDVKTASKRIKDAHPMVLIEASGGINENNILTFTVANVDIISSSIFCQGYKCIDLSLNIVNETVSLTTAKIDTVNDTSTVSDVEVIDLDLTDKSAEFNLPDTSVTSTPKAGIKRKVDEAPIKTADTKIVTTTADTSKKEVKEVDTKTVKPTNVTPSPIRQIVNASKNSAANVSTTNSTAVAKTAVTAVTAVTAATAATKTSTPAKATAATKTITDATKPTPTTGSLKTSATTKPTQSPLPKSAAKSDAPPNKQAKFNNSATKASYLSKNLATARTAGFRTQGANNGRGSSSSLSSLMRPMNSGGGSSGNNAPMAHLPFHNSNQGNQHNDSFFHGATPMKLGGSSLPSLSSSARSSMNNLIDQRSMMSPSDLMMSSYRSYGPGGMVQGGAGGGAGGFGNGGQSMMSGGNYGFYCKSCNYQNPINGPPICRICRKMLN